MRGIVITALYCIFLINGYSQIGEKDFMAADKLDQHFAETIDSFNVLTQNCKLVYSHDTLFRCIHFTTSQNSIHLVDIRYLDDNAGYLRFKVDSVDYLVFESRSDGSGNLSDFMFLNKQTGKFEIKKTTQEENPAEKKIARAKKKMESSGVFLMISLVAFIVSWGIRRIMKVYK